ncbi:MAG: alanine--tRNA ligase [Acidaminobacteraceae bacterium]
MKNMGVNEIRSRFLEFFESKGHLIENSFPLVPQNDKSLLLINAGMAPLKNYFSGVETPPSNRMTTCQKCIRTGDIENVGYTARHATFFEMLGNFSFGDYFKHESIAWGWEFVTKVLDLPVDKLWATVYLEDDEAFDIWKDEVGIPEDRIIRLGKSDNFWEIGTGPCGPCSEIYFDMGQKFSCGLDDCAPGCECDRYLEFWNHVFTQFDRQTDGSYKPLAKKNIDTGMGLERIACIMQGVDSIFEIDTINHILKAVCDKAMKEYGVDTKTDVSIRIITDHIRAVSFLVSDGVMPNNEGRGYVLRKLLRRAARHGKLLGIEGNFLVDLVDDVIKVSGDAYPELVQREEYIKKIIMIEEERFQQTIDQGLEVLINYINELEVQGVNELSGENAFKLYDTYGFPLDLTMEILEEKNMTVNEDLFNKSMEDQKDRARSARKSDLGWEEDPTAKIDSSLTSEFVGYFELDGDATLKAIIVAGDLVDEAKSGDKAVLVLDRTTFYPEGGGQVGDKGLIVKEGFEFKVKDTKKSNNGLILHTGIITSGSIKINDSVVAKVDPVLRLDTSRNHSATHLLHKALRTVLGDHVEQSGSHVDEQKLRFDFTHFQAISKDEIEEIETMVNEMILSPKDVDVVTTSIIEAKEMGAMALFGEKYGSEVRVVKMDDYSTELCGGTHLDNTGKVALIKIVSETGVAAGVRRIEAITGRKVYEMLNSSLERVSMVSDLVKSSDGELVNKVTALVNENKDFSKELDKFKQSMASNMTDDLLKNAEFINGFNVVIAHVKDIELSNLKQMGDEIKDKLSNSVVVLANEANDKIIFVVMASDDAVSSGAHSGNIIREIAKIAGGGGGGKPNMAQAGGKDIAKIADSLDKARQVISSL